jgi:hypothetical protein
VAFRIAVCCAVLAIVAVAGCGGGDDDTTPASLKGQLLPASQVPGFKVQRPYEWDNSVDFVVQGVPLPQSTAPSKAVEVMDDAGFLAGAGEDLEPESGGERGVGVRVARFGSDDDARDVADYVYAEGLKLPCYGSCTEHPSSFAVAGIPGAKGVQQRPSKPGVGASGPPGFDAYGVVFTIGPTVYLVGGQGGPGQLQRSVVVDAAQKLYQRVKAGDSDS